jgi:hypothetical protein
VTVLGAALVGAGLAVLLLDGTWEGWLPLLAGLNLGLYMLDRDRAA